MRVVRELINNLPSKRFALVLVFPCLLGLSLIATNIVVADNPCPNSWNITIQGLKSTYNRGETINVSATYSIRNHSLSPGTIQQILVGILDDNRQVYDVTCIYNGSANVCPKETTGTANLVLKCPSSPGTYQILASNYLLYSCEDAERIFPKNPASDKKIADIQVANSPIANESDGTPTSPQVSQKSASTGWIITLFAIVIIGLGLWRFVATGRSSSEPRSSIRKGNKVYQRYTKIYTHKSDAHALVRSLKSQGYFAFVKSYRTSVQYEGSGVKRTVNNYVVYRCP